MAKKTNTVSTTKPSKHRSSNDSYTYNKYSGLVSIKDVTPKRVPIKDKNPKDQYEPRYVTASKPQGKSKTEIVPIKDYVPPKSSSGNSGSVSANGGTPRKRKTTYKKY